MGINNIVRADDRLKSMLKNDKKENPIKMSNLIKSELYFVLKNYMDIELDDIKFDLGIDNNGRYILSLSAEVNRLYGINYLL